MPNESTITVRQNSSRHRYELLDGDKVIGKAHWLSFDRDASSERIFSTPRSTTITQARVWLESWPALHLRTPLRRI